MLLVTELTDVVTRLVNEECGDRKFVGIKNVCRDEFLVLLFQSGVILQDLTDNLNNKYQIRLGTPENTPHRCPKHLLYLLEKYNVPGDMRAVVKGLLENQHISEALYATKEILISRTLFVICYSLLLWQCLLLFGVCFIHCRWNNS